MLAWAGGKLVGGVLDNYPGKPEDPTITLSKPDISRALGADIPLGEAQEILMRLGFQTAICGEEIVATSPDTRRHIEPGLIGKANLIEEISRVYGFDRIPAKRLSSASPPQRGNPAFESEEKIRDILVSFGLTGHIRLPTDLREREARIYPASSAPAQRNYVRIKKTLRPLTVM